MYKWKKWEQILSMHISALRHRALPLLWHQLSALWTRQCVPANAYGPLFSLLQQCLYRPIRTTFRTTFFHIWSTSFVQFGVCSVFGQIHNCFCFTLFHFLKQSWNMHWFGWLQSQLGLLSESDSAKPTSSSSSLSRKAEGKQRAIKRIFSKTGASIISQHHNEFQLQSYIRLANTQTISQLWLQN